MKKLIHTFFVVLFLAGPLFSAEWETITDMNYVRDIVLKDQKVWSATEGGLAVFDTRTRSFRKITNIDGLGEVYILSVAQDSSGNFWLGGDRGTLTKHNPDTDFFRVYQDFASQELKIWDITPEGDRLWIASKDRVSLFLTEKNEGEVKETYKGFGSISPDTVSSVCLTPDRVWVGTEDGAAFASKDFTQVNLQDPQSWSSFEIGRVNVILYAEGEIFLGTPSGLLKFETNDSAFTSVDDSLGVTKHYINDLKYQGDKIYSATTDGIFYYADGRRESVTSENLFTKDAKSLFVDSSGNIWIGTAGEGLSFFDGSSWTNYPVDGPSGNIFMDLEFDQQGRLWCANWNDGLSSFGPEGWRSHQGALDSVFGISGILFHSLGVDKKNNLWVGTWGSGLFKFDNSGVWSHYDDQNSPLREAAGWDIVVVNGISVDQENTKWFLNEQAEEGRGLVALDDDDTSWSVFTTSDGLWDTIFINIGGSGDHVLVCHRWSGLCDLDYNYTPGNKGDDHWRCYTTEELLGDAQCAVVDRRGVLWVGTNSGLVRYNSYFDQFDEVAYPQELGLKVNCIGVDGYNNKWVGTDEGLGVLNDQEEFALVFNTSNSDLVYDQINTIVIEDQSGAVWIGTQHGLSKYTPSKQKISSYPNPVVVTFTGGDNLVTFKNVPLEAKKIRIYTLAGELVKEIEPGAGWEWEWDLKNKQGQSVASGIYLFHLQVENGEGTLGKIAVVREQ